MNPTPVSPLISFSIILGMFICILSTILIFFNGLTNLPLTNKRKLKVIFLLGFVLLFWAALAITLAVDGFFVNDPSPEFQFPTIVLIFIPVILGAIVLISSKPFKLILDAVPLQWIIGIQSIRTAGIVFLILYFQHLLPGQFALPAGLGDMLVGITAPFVAYLYYAKKKNAKKIAILWNITGTLDLILALAFGFLTSPSPVQLFALDNPNRFIGMYPLVLVPAFAVPLFILYHFYTFRRLNAKTINQMVHT